MAVPPNVFVMPNVPDFLETRVYQMMASGHIHNVQGDLRVAVIGEMVVDCWCMR